MSIVLPSTYTAPAWAIWAAGQGITDAEWLRQIQAAHRLYADIGARVPLWYDGDVFSTTDASATQVNEGSGLDLDTIDAVCRMVRPYQVSGTVTYGLTVYLYGDEVELQVEVTTVANNTSLGTAAPSITGGHAWDTDTITFTEAEVIDSGTPRALSLSAEILSAAEGGEMLHAYAVPFALTASNLPLG